MCHATADADRMLVMKDGVTASDYMAYLATIHGFEAPVGAVLEATPDLGAWIDVAGRTRLRRLRADLTALGVADPVNLPACRGLAPFASPANALGWLYVVERNTLVDGLVLRHLRPRLPAALDLAGSYLASVERSAGVRWRELGAALDRRARTARDGDAIIAGARNAFRCQHRWYLAPTVRIPRLPLPTQNVA